MPAPPSHPIPNLPAPATRRSVTTLQLLLPWAGLALASAVLMAGNGDQWLADQLYRWQGQHWALKQAWWTSGLIHHGGKQLSVALSVTVAVAWLASCFSPRWRAWRRPLGYLLLAVALSTGLVSLLKALTQMDCPWDLQRYGGTRPFVGLLQARPAALGNAACFPAGHASAAYAWVALYFFFNAVKPRWRWPALAMALLAGAVFGGAQQLRGAHFLSHDLWTLTICWSVAVLLNRWLLCAAAWTAPTHLTTTQGACA